MKIALYHGYELSGSGSNEYTRYLASTLADLGHEVAVVCGEPAPRDIPFVRRAVAYDAAGTPRELFRRTGEGPEISLHQLPRTSVYPVFLTDRQRVGVVKAFPDLSDGELADYCAAMRAVVTRVLADERPDVLHVNHLVVQPAVAAVPCAAAGVPFYIVPHGSAIEYTIKRDERYLALARDGLLACSGVVWIAREVRDRVLALFPDLRQEIEAKSRMVGVGTDVTLFAPIAQEDRGTALAELARMHRPGGKTAAQRDALRERIDAGDLSATRAYWDAYDHNLEDDDMPALLSRVDVADDVLLFVGAMTYGKGVQTLIAAMPGILARRPRTRLVLVGSGSFREVLEGLWYSLVSGNEVVFDELVARGRDLERDATSGPLADIAHYAQAPSARALLF